MSKCGEITLDDDEICVATVGEFTRRVKEVLENGIAPGWVRGEISNLREQASGHVYFSLKDNEAQLSAVMFRGDAMRQNIKLRVGQQVLVYGELNVYEVRGQYQLIVRVVVEDGVGRLQQEFEALKQRLSEEGLFDADRKTELPTMPATVGFITSPTGAAVQDFIRIMIRRGWRGRVVVLPAKVQGDGAASEMVDMLKIAQAQGIFDLIVIGRGGGSLEDLWAFNEEPLVRAIGECIVPVVSAVGHEIDFTLSDFVADVRVETPSAAAELVSSHFVEALERVEQAARDMITELFGAVETARAQLDHAQSRLRLLSPSTQIDQGFLRLDDCANRLTSIMASQLQERRHSLATASSDMARLSPEIRVQQESQRLLSLWKRLQSVSPASVLQRGFAIVRDEEGNPVARKAGLTSGQKLQTEFGDGTLPVRVE
ncbi:MAG: exodeoxyribonuclease VII large subunit [Opitutaceae bacterium]|nr:exodeoxyribonuclease VII large subunit [Opitutaceae bacterium]